MRQCIKNPSLPFSRNEQTRFGFLICSSLCLVDLGFVLLCREGESNTLGRPIPRGRGNSGRGKTPERNFLFQTTSAQRIGNVSISWKLPSGRMEPVPSPSQELQWQASSDGNNVGIFAQASNEPHHRVSSSSLNFCSHFFNSLMQPQNLRTRLEKELGIALFGKALDFLIYLDGSLLSVLETLRVDLWPLILVFGFSIRWILKIHSSNLEQKIIICALIAMIPIWSLMIPLLLEELGKSLDT